MELLPGAKLHRFIWGRSSSYNNELFGWCSLLVTDLMLFLCLSLLMSYPLICFILKQYVLLCTTYLPILCLRISVIFLFIHLTSIHITLDFLMLVIYMLINQDWEFNLIRFPFSEPSCGIAWSLTCVNLQKNLSKIKFINFCLRYLVMRMIMLMSLR